MKILMTSMALATTLAWCLCAAIADERGPSGKGPAGIGGASGAVEHAAGGGVEHAAPNLDRAAQEAERATNEAATGTNNAANGANIAINRDRIGADVNRDRNINNRERDRADARIDNRRAERLGASDFDRNGIGRLDADRFRDRNDNRWRYSQWHNHWWYWQPGGYWVFWNGDRWNRYDADNYVDDYYYAQPQGQMAANASGPYYEDQGGFFTYQGNRKVYDPHIQRVSNEVGQAGAPAPR